jgi:hypothetical protein
MGDTNQHIEADLVHVQPRQEPEPEAGSGPEPEPEPAPPPTSAAEMLRRRRTLRTEQGSLPGDTAANLRLYARDTPLTPEPPPPAPAPAPGPTVPSNGDEALITDEELERVIASLDRMLAGNRLPALHPKDKGTYGDQWLCCTQVTRQSSRKHHGKVPRSSAATA